MEPEDIRITLLRRYAAVAEQPAGQFQYPVGRDMPSDSAIAATSWTASPAR